MKISFFRYAAIVKNLRGVVLCGDCSSEKAEWLFSKFRYRSLGFPPSVYQVLKKKRKNFVELYYPSETIAKIVERVSKKVDKAVAESLILASTYISPLLVVEHDFSFFERTSVAEVRTSKLLSDKDWRLHLRIADYTVLDFYQWSTLNAWSAIRERRVDEALEERERKILKDVKRYWRISSERGRVFLVYVDNLRLFYSLRVLDDISMLGEDAAASMAIIPAVYIF